MAGEDEGPIVIGSDDEYSDNDDVVFTKIEIEVDSEDVIFLSETKPPPKVEDESAAAGDLGSQDIPTIDTNTNGGALTRSTSVTTEAGRLSLEDEVKVTPGAIVGNTSLMPNVPGPLDLSAKQAGDLGSHNGDVMPKYDLQQDKLFNQNPLEKFLDIALSPPPSLTSLLADLQATFDMASVPCTNDDATKLQSVGPSNQTPLASDAVSSSIKDTDIVTNIVPSIDKGCINSGSNFTTVSSSAPVCSDIVSQNIVCKSETKHKVLGKTEVGGANTSSDGNVSVSVGDTSSCASVSVSPGASVGDTSSHVNAGASVSVSPSGHVNAGTSVSVSPSGHATSVITHSSIAGSSLMTHTSIAGSTHSSSVPCTTSSLGSTPSASVGVNTPISTPLQSDPFAASHLLLASLDSQWSTDLQAQSVFHPTSTSCHIKTGSQFGMQTCAFGSKLNKTGYSDNYMNQFQLSSCIGGLPGGSVTSLHNNSLHNNPLKRSLSTSDEMYNSLTLPLAMQTPQIKHSSSMCNMLGPSTSAAGHSGSDNKSTKPGYHPLRPPYLFNDSAIPLPPKKQRRCFSHDGPRRLICTNCTALLDGEEYSQCPSGHSTCSRCLKERVKLVLSGKEKESIKCLNRHCDSYYPMSELKLTLSPFVVEILEEKLDSEMIADMILKNNSSETAPSVDRDIEMDKTTPVNVESEVKMEKFLKKYEDMPDHWDAMAEKVVSKDGYELVKLEHTSSEYEDVVAKFFESMVDSNVEVVGLHRVQNPIQWKYYTVKRAEMTRDNEGFGCVEEQKLFHGTNSSVVEAICRKGFDWRLCGKHGTMYGQGSYFAVNASYSHQYTDLRQSKKMSIGSTMMTANPFSMTLPTQPSLIYPPVNINFGQLPAPMGASNSAFSVLNLSQSTPPTPTGHPQQNVNNINQPGPSVSSSKSGLQHNNNNNSNTVFPSTSQGISKSCRLGPLHPHAGNQSNSLGTSHTGLTGAHYKICKFRVNPRPAHIRQLSGLPSAMMSTRHDHIEPTRPTAKMFLAKVLVGKYVGGESKYRKPPPLEPKLDPFGKCYDSCVDDIRNPKIFVIFDTAQAYPEYLLEYRLCM